MTDAGGSFDLELAAASLRADSSDVRILVSVLADQLADALGPRLTVERTGGRFRRPKEIRSLKIVADEDEFAAELDGPVLRCTVGHSSGGIRIRSEKVDVDTWLARLLARLEAEAAGSQAVRQALEAMVIGGTAPAPPTAATATVASAAREIGGTRLGGPGPTVTTAGAGSTDTGTTPDAGAGSGIAQNPGDPE